MKKASFPRILLALLLAHALPTMAFDADCLEPQGTAALVHSGGSSSCKPAALNAGLHAAPAKVIVVTDAEVTPVPEPETYSMLLIGIGLIAFMSRRKKKNDKLC